MKSIILIFDFMKNERNLKSLKISPENFSLRRQKVLNQKTGYFGTPFNLKVHAQSIEISDIAKLG